MSQENVERVRESLEAFARRDKAAWCELCDPNLEVVPIGDWPESEPIRGREAAWDFFVAFEEPWEPGSYEMAEVMHSAKSVVTRLKRDMRGKSSGIEVQYDYWMVVTIRDRKAVRLEWFEKRESALEAAGLRE
jgi:ketosteroid isomerase-like protein